VTTGASTVYMECGTSIQSSGTYNPGITTSGNNFTYGTVAFTLQ
jgi:hypothetical protein